MNTLKNKFTRLDLRSVTILHSIQSTELNNYSIKQIKKHHLKHSKNSGEIKKVKNKFLSNPL
jgi:hypothetical protein